MDNPSCQQRAGKNVCNKGTGVRVLEEGHQVATAAGIAAIRGTSALTLSCMHVAIGFASDIIVAPSHVFSDYF